MTNETKFTVVISYFEDWETNVCKYNSLREMLQDLFFDGYDVPFDEWIEDPNKYQKDILNEINIIMEQSTEACSFNIFYISGEEIKELSIDEIDEDELITAYLTFVYE